MRHQSTYWHRHWYVSIHLLSIHTSSSRPQGAVAYPRIHWTSTTYSTFCHQTHMGEHSHTYSQFKVSASPDLHEWGRKHQILPMAELFWRSFSHKDKKRWHNYERRSYKVEHVIVEKWLERSLTQGKSEINSQLVFIVEFLVCWQWFILVLLHFYITSVASGFVISISKLSDFISENTLVRMTSIKIPHLKKHHLQQPTGDWIVNETCEQGGMQKCCFLLLEVYFAQEFSELH